MFFYALIGVALGARVNEMAAPGKLTRVYTKYNRVNDFIRSVVYHPAQAEWRQQRLGRAVSSWGSGDNCAYDAAYHKCCTKNETQYDEWTNNDSFNCPFYGVEEEQATTTKKSGPPKKKSNTLWIVLLRVLPFLFISTF